MPSSSEILASLTAIARHGTVVAIAWHVVFAVAIVAVATGWRPTERAVRGALAGPLLSVAIFAIGGGTPFNGVVFAAAAIALVLLGADRDPHEVIAGAPWMQAIAGALIAYGWVYPHFLAGPALAYVFAAPVGLVPCPTLAIVIGFALLGGGLGSRAWSLVLAGLGLCYGVFGVVHLGIGLDLGLVAGAIVLAVVAMHPRERTSLSVAA